MTDLELMQMALDALNNFDKGNHGMRWQVPIIKALRSRLLQPEPAECDGGQCGIGGYCKECTKPLVKLKEMLEVQGCERENVKPEPKIINMEAFVGHVKPVVPVCWMNANDIDKTDWKVWAHGKPTVSMPLFASPTKKEWVSLTEEEILADDVLRYHFGLNGGAGPISKKGMAVILAVNAKLKEKNT